MEWQALFPHLSRLAMAALVYYMEREAILPVEHPVFRRDKQTGRWQLVIRQGNSAVVMDAPDVDPQALSLPGRRAVLIVCPQRRCRGQYHYQCIFAVAETNEDAWLIAFERLGEFFVADLGRGPAMAMATRIATGKPVPPHPARRQEP